MTTVDWIIVVLLAGSVLAGLMQGFVRAVCAAAGLLGGLVLAAWNYPSIGQPISQIVKDLQLANAIGFLLITIAVLAVGVFIGVILSHALHKMGLGCLDRLAGAIFGMMQGVIVVTVGMIVTLAFYPKAAWLTESRLPPYFFRVCHLSTHVTPDGLADKVQSELKTLQEASPNWMHRSSPSR